jgi:hypothetical protein
MNTTGTITMSMREVDRLKVIQAVVERQLKPGRAAERLCVSVRQIERLVWRYRADGARGLVSGKRGRTSNHRLPDGVAQRALALIREKLRECHGIELAVETIRSLMTAAGLWVPRKQRLPRIHQPRNRRACLGELIQIDGSDHRWFEDRAPACTLLVFIDDATGRLMTLHFTATESTFSYFEALSKYLRAHGKPMAFYSDKASVFYVKNRSQTAGKGMTQFGRALYELNIDSFCANTSQAKGRVERANLTLQDRLVKELRLSGIDTMEAGNAFLPDFVEDYNARFAIIPARPDDLHRPLNLAPDRLTEILCKREQRYVGSQLTFSFERKRIMLEETEITRGLVGRYVETYAYADGRLDVRWKGYSLPYQVFDKDQRVTHAAITENKRLGDVLAYIKERQEQQDKPVVKSNSEKIGYKPSGRKPGRRTDFLNDPAVIARRQKALARQQAAE